MSRVGPLVETLTARRTAAGVTVFARPAGPAGLATAELAAGGATVAVDVAEPANLVSVSFRDRQHPQTARLLEVLLDPQVLAELDRAALPSADEQRIWTYSPDLRDRSQPVPGELGHIGRLALLTGELTRVARTSLAIGLGLLELAASTARMESELSPVYSTDQLLQAALALLDNSDEQDWTKELADVDRPRLLRQIDGWSSTISLRSRDAAGHIASISGLLQPTANDEVERVLSSVLDYERSLEVSDMEAGASAPIAAGRGRRVADKRLTPRDQPVPVLVDPSVSDLNVDEAWIEGGHLFARGTGSVITDVWLRFFAADQLPQPVLLGMAPLHATAIGEWSSRGLLPADHSAQDLLVDLTTRPREPWSYEARNIAEATALGAEAARADRIGLASAPEQWTRAEQAWSRNGDKWRRSEAVRLGLSSRQGSTGPGPNTAYGELSVDLLPPN